MAELELRGGRERNARATREAILNAAEAVFAEHGFEGARLDAIARISGYNKSLIGQYFGDKLGLYCEVIRRADHATRDLQMQPIAWLAEDETALSSERFASLLKRFMGELFDFYLQHPQIARILVWEMAEGWQTYGKMAAQLDTSELEQLRPLLSKIKEAGLLHSDIDPMIQFVLAQALLMLFQACIPLFRLFLPPEDQPSQEAQARAREFIVSFITRGLLADLSKPKATDD
jgi:TetR/AcrR family transcriptional regulator